jgi:hypothetical protein
MTDVTVEIVGSPQSGVSAAAARPPPDEGGVDLRL